MPTVSTNTTFFPVQELQTPKLRQLTRGLSTDVRPPLTPAETLRRHREVIEGIAEALIRQALYNETFRLSLEDALRAIHQRIDQRPAVGILANRGDPAPDGIMYFATDALPAATMFVAANGVWEKTQSTP
jgi:hypothetical protein